MATFLPFLTEEDRLYLFQAQTMAPLSTKELHQFHKTDRDFFCFLIFKLRRDATQSLLVMALWLWLEHIGYPNLIHTFNSISNHSLLNDIVDEAVACLNCLQTEKPDIPGCSGLTATRSVIHRDISIRLFIMKRHTAIAGIRSVLKNTCSRIFGDILQIIVKRNDLINGKMGSTSGASRAKRSGVLTLPGFPHPLFGDFDMTPQTPTVDLLDSGIWGGKRPSDDVTVEDRTMFVTFSKGFPVSEKEVIQFFTGMFGDCIETLNMDRNVNSQNLYAVMVLKDVATVDRILTGQQKAKLQFNGKHIWARKYEIRKD